MIVDKPMNDGLIPKPISLSLDSLAATAEVGDMIGRQLPEMSIGLFTGELAAGKTTFIKAICGGMGIDPKIVISPTYTMTNIYQGRLSVFHVDLYRLTSPDEIDGMDVDDWINPIGPTLIEWPQVAGRVLVDLPTISFHLTLQGNAATEGRHLVIAPESNMYASLTKALANLTQAVPLTSEQSLGLWRPCKERTQL